MKTRSLLRTLRLPPALLVPIALALPQALGCTASRSTSAPPPSEETLDDKSTAARTAPTATAPAFAQPGDPTSLGVLGHGYGGGGAGIGSDGKPSGTAAAPPTAPMSPMSPQRGALGGARAANNPSGGLANLAAAAKDLPFAEPTQRLDPNARYATTYRPGGAAMAAFDAAVARGSIPVIYKDLVADFGARYAPTIEKPTSAAMAFRVDSERAAIGPHGGSLNLRIAMRSTDVAPARAPLSVHLVLDVSGSMSGAAIENAKSAAEALVQKLDPADDFSMVTFSSDAKVLVPDGVIGARRASVLSAIHAVQAEGGTNISAGLDLGYAEAHRPWIRPEAVKLVMLLSDGHANAGDTRSDALAERSAHAFQDGVQTSTFGLGPDFDAPLMSGIADRGAGGYYYLADSSQIASALSRELDARVQPVAQALEVRVRLRPDVAATRVYGSRQLGALEAMQVRAQEIAADTNAQKGGIKRDRQTDAEGGMRFFMPAFSRDDRHAIVVTLDVPEGAAERSIASVEVRYKDRITKTNVTREIPVRVRYAKDDAESAASVDASVARTVQAFAAGDAIAQASALADRGQRAAAAALLNERAEILRAAASALAEPMLAEDATRITRLAGAVIGTAQIGDPMPLAVLLRGSAYGYLR